MSAVRSDGETVIWEASDEKGLRTISVRLDPDGGLVIEGQDLGPIVRVFGPGFSEYEWAWSAEASEVPKILEVLGGAPGDDPIQLLREFVRDAASKDPGPFLEAAGVTLEFWSRVGE